MATRKKKFLIGGCIIVALLALTGAWKLWISATRVAFVNYQVITLGEISKACDNPSIKISELSVDNLDKLDRYDMVFISGMGLRITEEQRATIQQAADNGVPILTTAATNPANRIISLDSVAADSLRSFLGNGGRRNYRSMLNYVRARIDGKKYNTAEPDPVVERANEMIYHIDPQNPDDEELGFNTVAEYNAFLEKNGLMLGDNAPRIVVTGMMGDPTDLIARLEATGNVVYPVRSIKKFVTSHHIDSVRPIAVINMAHGRMGDYMVEYLAENNILLFAPLNINRLVSEWEQDKIGMSGGFLSQSVVTPEIDGAIRPFTLFGHYLDDEGLQHLHAIPGRLDDFVATVNNHIALKSKPNSEKRIAIYYYKGPGQSALTAAGLEVAPSLFNLLKRLQREGYNVDGLPATWQELEKMIQSQGAVFNLYAEGAFDEFMATGNPALVGKEEYEQWVAQSLQPEAYAEVVAANGEFPGRYMATQDGRLGVARVQLGNIALLPQNAAGTGDDAFKIVHGTNAAPPHTYVASYLWVQHGFKADALIHFGTHGSLEFTPSKQAALGNSDWPDRLVGSMPHYYVYTIADVGEGVIAKRRAYATLQSHLTAPFMESNLRSVYKDLTEAIRKYNDLIPADGKTASQDALDQASLEVKRLTVELGVHSQLHLDSILSVPYTEDEIQRIETFGEEIANEKITGQLYTLGEPYEDARITSSVYAMATDPIAYSLLALDKLKGKADAGLEKHQSQFTRRYLEPAKAIVGQLLANPSIATDQYVCRIAGITMEELTKARQIDSTRNSSVNLMDMMMSMAQEAPAEAKTHGDVESAVHGAGDTHSKGHHHHGGSGDASKMPDFVKKMIAKKMKNMDVDEMVKAVKEMGMEPDNAIAMARGMGMEEDKIAKLETALNGNTADTITASTAGKQNSAAMASMMKEMMSKPEYTREEITLATAVMEVERTLKNVGNYRMLLRASPEAELSSIVNALNGGYTQPSPGGDPIANPNTLPTGRNLFAINAEETPTEDAWEKGKKLAENTIEMYRKNHNDSLPRKVSYTLWSGEFIESGGATIAQVLYMLGVEPIRDTFGRVTDLRLIPSEDLGRPRIDVVVQTSGQLRDIAASRLFLINRAVEMAAAASDDKYTNLVAEGIVEAERTLIEKGLSPKEAREVSYYRVFGGLNGGYGTGIQGMVTAGDRWESDKEIADVYLHNMGAFYGSEKDWEKVREYAFEAALTRTDAVIQPRQSNTWGALSLDHVYEFMGGMNLAVRNVTGKDPDAYLSDYRNRNNARMQEVKEAIGIESRTTIFNPTYIKEKMKGGATSASTFAEIVQNTYGWNVMKPDAIDNEMWDEVYNVYVKDKFGLGVQKYFETQSPAALEEMTAVMMETARKGMWKATDEQLADIARLHTELVNKYKPSCSGFVCDNAKLRQYIADRTDPATAAQYRESINQIRQAAADKKGVVMKKEEMNSDTQSTTSIVSNTVVGVVVAAAVVLIVVMVHRRRKKMQD